MEESQRSLCESYAPVDTYLIYIPFGLILECRESLTKVLAVRSNSMTGDEGQLLHIVLHPLLVRVRADHAMNNPKRFNGLVASIPPGKKMRYFGHARHSVNYCFYY